MDKTICDVICERDFESTRRVTMSLRQIVSICVTLGENKFTSVMEFQKNEIRNLFKWETFFVGNSFMEDKRNKRKKNEIEYFLWNKKATNMFGFITFLLGIVYKWLLCHDGGVK
jgi:hypothetical protein